MRVGIALLVVALGVVGCAKKIRRPPRLDTACGGDAANNGCNTPPPVGSTPPVEGGTEGGITDAASSDAGVSLVGSVSQLTSDDFSTAKVFSGTAGITAGSPGGGDSTGSYDGHSFSIDNVLVGPSVWFSVTPLTGGASALPTLEPWDTTSSGPVALRMVRSTVIDQIFDLVTLPPQRDATRGQIVLHFVDSNGKALSGVKITQNPGASIIYDAGGTWSDTAAATGTRGFAIVVNAAPGFRQRIDLSTGSKLVYVEVQVAKGSVTLTDVLLAP